MRHWLLAVALLAAEQEPDAAARARALLAAGNTPEALELLEEAVQRSPADAAGWSLLAEGYAQLAAEWEAAGSDPSPPLWDALGAWREALDLEPRALAVARRVLETQLALGSWVDAGILAERLLGRLALEASAAPAWLWVAAGQARLGRFLAAPPEAPGAFGRAFQDAYHALQAGIPAAPAESALALGLADLLQAADLPASAARAVLAGLERNPAAVELHQRLIDLHFYHDAVLRLPELYAELGNAAPAEPTVLWYQGYVELLLGDRLRKELRYVEARSAYGRCLEWQGRAVELHPDYAESARRIGFLARLGAAWCSLSEGALAPAAAEFLELLREHSDLRGMPDGLGRSLLDGIGILEAQLVRSGEYAVGLELARSIAEQEAEASWWNNLGYLLREHAVQVAARASGSDAERLAAARPFFEESWQAYLEACERAPDDARIVNDAALIQAYHLRTELPRAEAMFRHAIEAADRQLAALGEDPAEEERFPVAQAQGDAWQNLGFLAYHVHRDLEQARAYFEASLATRSGPRPEVQASVDALDGKEPPPEDPFVTAPRPGADREVAAAQVPWELSFTAGQARAARERRPLVVYYRGAGRSDLAPFLDDWVCRRDFLEATREAVCVLADQERSAFLERRADGSRIPCPRFGGLSCSDAQQSAAEFLSWWAEQRTAEDPASPEERFYYFAPDGERHEPENPWAVGSAVRALVESAGAPRPGFDAGQAELRLEGVNAADRAAAAAEIVQAGQQALLETLLWDARRPFALRQALVRAVAASAEPRHAELSRALLRQEHDPELAQLALESWPGPDPREPRRALEWSPFPGVQEAAARWLVQNVPGESWRLLAARLVAGESGQRRAAAAALAAAGLAEDREEFLCAVLERERAPEVRAVLCRLLAAGTRPATRSVLEALAEEDPDARVRAAAGQGSRP